MYTILLLHLKTGLVKKFSFRMSSDYGCSVLLRLWLYVALLFINQVTHLIFLSGNYRGDLNNVGARKGNVFGIWMVQTCSFDKGLVFECYWKTKCLFGFWMVLNWTVLFSSYKKWSRLTVLFGWFWKVWTIQNRTIWKLISNTFSSGTAFGFLS